MKFHIPTILALIGLVHCYDDDQPTTVSKFEDHGNGNRGIGTGDQWDGRNNRWIGDDNTIVGSENSLNGNTNQVNGRGNWIKGDSNQIQGKENIVKGGSNQVQGKDNVVEGKGNIVRGKGNIVTSDLGDDFQLDLTSRFPSWMRDSEDTPKPKPGQKKKNVPSGLLDSLNFDIETRFPAWMRGSRSTNSFGKSMNDDRSFGWKYAQYRPSRSVDNFRLQPQLRFYNDDQETNSWRSSSRRHRNHDKSSRWDRREPNQYSRQSVEDFRQSLRGRIRKQISDEFNSYND